MRRSILAHLFITLPVIALATAAISAPRYAITDLGTLGGDTEATGINNLGQVIGASQAGAARDQHAFLWSNGRMRDLGTAGWQTSYAAIITDQGLIRGGLMTAGAITVSESFIWQLGRMRIAEPVRTPWGKAEIADITRAGRFLGVIKGNNRVRAVIWGNGQPVNLGIVDWQPAGLNDRGDVLGSASTQGESPRVILWSRGRIAKLPASVTSASALNNNGGVVGWAATKSGESHAFLWKGGKMTDLGTLKGGSSYANEINDAGQIVGSSQVSEALDFHAVVWDRGKLHDLNTLIPAGSGWVLRDAVAVNNRGQVAGSGLHNGRRRAFLLTPVRAR